MRLYPLLIALQFLTRLPVNLPHVPDARESGQSLLFYPLVGLLTGLLLLPVALLAAGAGTLLQAALVLTLWVWLTGGLHLDGLADTADAWAGGHRDPVRTLAIMKDPACGPAGVVTLVLVLLLKFVALVSLLQAGAWQALLLAPWLGRWMLPALLATTPYVRPGGLGALLVQQIPASWPVVLVLHGLVMLLVAPGIWLPMLVVMLFALGWRRALCRRIGGTTGDTAGALLEMVECLLLVAAALWLGAGFGQGMSADI